MCKRVHSIFICNGKGILFLLLFFLLSFFISYFGVFCFAYWVNMSLNDQKINLYFPTVSIQTFYSAWALASDLYLQRKLGMSDIQRCHWLQADTCCSQYWCNQFTVCPRTRSLFTPETKNDKNVCGWLQTKTCVDSLRHYAAGGLPQQTASFANNQSLHNLGAHFIHLFILTFVVFSLSYLCLLFCFVFCCCCFLFFFHD